MKNKVIVNAIANVLKNIKHGLVVDRNEPDVRQKQDRYGNLYWQVYDYKNNKFLTFGSDKEVRIWLEQRYYRT